MLTRLTVRRTPALLVRRLSDKPGDGNNDPLPPEGKAPDAKKTSSTDKIQELLKSMMEANKAREAQAQQARPHVSTAPGIYRKIKAKPVVPEVKEETIEESITQAASKVAEALGGDVKQTESELLSKVLGNGTQEPSRLSDLILGMKIDRSREPEEVESRGQQVKRLVSRSRRDTGQDTGYRTRQPRRDDTRRSVTQATILDIFDAEPLGIFQPTDTPNYGTQLSTWDRLRQRELNLATSQPPANYFQKMVQWTEQGKVWKFPIDNEQGLDDEAKVHFSEHIFLDTHLEGWCPQRGPIRHFMELVCIGLSKNPYYTAQEKKDHIMWYKEYFEDKKDLLTEIGALDNVKPKAEV